MVPDNRGRASRLMLACLFLLAFTYAHAAQMKDGKVMQLRSKHKMDSWLAVLSETIDRKCDSGDTVFCKKQMARHVSDAIIQSVKSKVDKGAKQWLNILQKEGIPRQVAANALNVMDSKLTESLKGVVTALPEEVDARSPLSHFTYDFSNNFIVDLSKMRQSMIANGESGKHFDALIETILSEKVPDAVESSILTAIGSYPETTKYASDLKELVKIRDDIDMTVLRTAIQDAAKQYGKKKHMHVSCETENAMCNTRFVCCTGMHCVNERCLYK